MWRAPKLIWRGPKKISVTPASRPKNAPGPTVSSATVWWTLFANCIRPRRNILGGVIARWRARAISAGGVVFFFLGRKYLKGGGQVLFFWMFLFAIIFPL